MKVVVTGAAGQIGRALVQALGAHEILPYAHAELDLCDFGSVRRILSSVRPEVVVNTAAFTRVDDCEVEPARAFSVNALAVRNMAQVCAGIGCIFVHLSTDYVFDGSKDSPYVEDDLPNPLSVYGTSKLVGEYFARDLVPRHYVIRTSGVYGPTGSNRRDANFVDTMLRLADEGRPIRVVRDQIVSPTAARNVAETIVELIRRDRYGLYHVTSTGECSWFEFAATIFQLAGLAPDLEPTTTVALARRARRPRYSVLAHARLAGLGLNNLPHWKTALARYLQELGRMPASPSSLSAG